jgi:hypothetical protein
MIRIAILGVVFHLVYFWIINRNNFIERGIRRLMGLPSDYWTWIGNKGENDTTPPPGEIKFSPEQQKAVDHIIEARLARERAAKADYDDLRKFKEESLKQQDAKVQKELEEQRKYEEAKKAYESQVNQHKEIINKKDYEITDLKIGHTLTNEISRQNGFIEETIALLKQSAALIEGNVFIKTKDANGIDVQLPVAEGVKRFLESRPHLVKSNFKAGGGGSGSTNPNTGGGNETETLSELNQKLSEAMSRGDNKEMNELNKKIRAKLTAQNVKF